MKGGYLQNRSFKSIKSLSCHFRFNLNSFAWLTGWLAFYFPSYKIYRGGLTFFFLSSSMYIQTYALKGAIYYTIIQNVQFRFSVILMDETSPRRYLPFFFIHLFFLSRFYILPSPTIYYIYFDKCLSYWYAM